ncbi:MAG: nitroreductase family protein [archaeon]|nr:nitroreductase family protein [archaeon]
MDFKELIAVRQSCRSYDPSRPVEDEKLLACIEAAKAAPSAVNDQPYDIWVVREKASAVSEAKASFNKFTDECRLFVIFTDAPYGHPMVADAASRMDIDFRTQDIGESIAYFTLQAADLGISTCILGSFDAEKIHSLLGTDARIQTVIAVGYSTEGYPVREKKRKPVSENVHFL